MLDFLKEKYLNEEFYDKYKWRIICSIIALIIALLFINLGFLKTLLIIILIVIGYGVGIWKDLGIDPINYISSLFK
ncbi:MAG: DUF2273 domain-containing protein [Andreesenia angusta]|nr:DUF2273 domain-containing protein [Andreesenia angusta]